MKNKGGYVHVNKPFGFLFLIALAAACSKPCPPAVTSKTPVAPVVKAAKAVPNGKIRVAVTISITGIAHLVDDASDKLVLIPNGKNFSPEHDLLLLASTRYSPTGLNTGPTPQKIGTTVVDTYMYNTLTGGTEIDLAKSGFDSTIDTTLVADSTGDQSYESCPPNAPRTSLHWLPNLRDVSHATGVMIDSDQTKPMPAPDVIAGRIKITGGALEAQLTPSADVFEFKAGGSGDRVQAVADRLNYRYYADVDANNPVVELWGGPYGQASTKLATATASKLTKRVYFMLANVPPGEFFAPMPKNTLEHFNYYYGIYKANVGSYTVAVPTRGNPEDSCGGGVGGGVECGPDRP
jgi:hypothetical protein